MEPSYFFTFEEILIFLKYGNFEAYLAENNPYFITEVWIYLTLKEIHTTLVSL